MKSLELKNNCNNWKKNKSLDSLNRRIEMTDEESLILNVQ